MHISFFLIVPLDMVSGFIIPEEIPSLLSLVYSKIPPIKKGKRKNRFTKPIKCNQATNDSYYPATIPLPLGTDSRVGFGFKLGPHADFQVMLELGPQTNTIGIGPTADPSGKREVLMMQNTDTLVSMVNTWKMPLGQTEDSPTEQLEPDDGENSAENEVITKNEKISTSSGGKWIDSWRNAFSRGNYFGKIKFKPIPGIDDRKGDRPIFRAQSQRPRRLTFVDQLRKLYRPKS